MQPHFGTDVHLVESYRPVNKRIYLSGGPHVFCTLSLCSSLSDASCSSDQKLCPAVCWAPLALSSVSCSLPNNITSNYDLIFGAHQKTPHKHCFWPNTLISINYWSWESRSFSGVNRLISKGGSVTFVQKSILQLFKTDNNVMVIRVCVHLSQTAVKLDGFSSWKKSFLITSCQSHERETDGIRLRKSPDNKSVCFLSTEHLRSLPAVQDAVSLDSRHSAEEDDHRDIEAPEQLLNEPGDEIVSSAAV